MELQENLFWLFMNDAIYVNKVITNNTKLAASQQ